MKPCQSKPFILFSLITLMVFGCNNPDSEKTENIQKEASQLVGTWQQTAIGKEDVSDFVVKIIFSDRTLTMAAPGCVIIGDYTTDSNMLSYTVTAVQGERCSKQQMIGQMCEDFLEKEVHPVLDRLDSMKEPDLMPQLLKKAGELGLLGAGRPEEYGGMGMDFLTQMDYHQEM